MSKTKRLRWSVRIGGSLVNAQPLAELRAPHCSHFHVPSPSIRSHAT